METVSWAPKHPLNCKWLLRNSLCSDHIWITCHRHAVKHRNTHFHTHGTTTTAAATPRDSPENPPISLPNLTCKRENPLYSLIFSFSFFPLLAKRKDDFSNLWQPSLLQDLVQLKTCGKPCGMFQMIPRCGLQTGLTHSFPAQQQGGGIKEALPGESLSSIKKLLSLSVDFCYFQSIKAHWTVA